MTSPAPSADIIAGLKQPTRAAARATALPISLASGELVGHLLPVGPWILDDAERVNDICEWRQRFMRMFLVQFVNSEEKARTYLRELSIGDRQRIFFLILDTEERAIGHIGLSGVTGAEGELDNLVRGREGGHARLIPAAEAALLAWAFGTLGLHSISARVLSYNWPVIGLHESLGFRVAQTLPLRKRQDGDFTLHDEVDATTANVPYACKLLTLAHADFLASLARPAED